MSNEARGALSKEAQAVHDAIALQKGDQPGHEFHGNQYAVDGGSSGKSEEKTTISRSALREKLQAATKEKLQAALNNKSTDPKVRAEIERELDDRANRGA